MSLLHQLGQFLGYAEDFISLGIPVKLKLEKVFVPLRVAPESFGQISSQIIQPQEQGEGLKIWQFLAASRQENAYRSIVIIGAPGSGKTTLLEHLTLIYAQKHQRKYYRQAPKLIPILLYLREVAATIYSTQPTLANLVEQQESIAQLNPRNNWFKEQLQSGNCLVMLDGLDEVADENQRQAVSSWLDKQIRDYPKAIFLLTSRPFGYESAAVSEIRTVLEVKPFNLGQMERFIHSWYLQNEIAASLGTEDAGIKRDAQNQANDLIARIKNKSSLASMALNPLLLTMIATVHSYRGALPGRRVELYAEICDVLLGRRQDAKGIPDSLTAEQKKIILQVLALELMERGIREFTPKQEPGLLEIIQEQLAAVTSKQLKPEDFLVEIAKISGLLVEKEKGVYGFAHKSFQEYLAAVEIARLNREEILTDNISNQWWQETIRLYAAQSDASNLIAAALAENTVPALKMALDCQEEGLRIKPEVRQQLEAKLEAGLSETSNLKIFQLAAEVMLAKRLSQFLRIDEQRAIDTGYITNAEYDLFLSDFNKWTNLEARISTSAKEPIRNVSWQQALKFCGWLDLKSDSEFSELLEDGERYYYRLPTSQEIKEYPVRGERVDCWSIGEHSSIGEVKGIRLIKTQTPAVSHCDVITVDARGKEINQEVCFAQYISEDLGGGIKLEMSFIPGGSFMMGSPEGEGMEREKPQHQVTIQPFFMAKFQITQAQWQAVMGNNPARFQDSPLNPVEHVSWKDAKEFCTRLSQKTGKEYRLPTEAEWEYACRAGTTTPYHFGENITVQLANYGRNVGKTISVGQFRPNAFGLYDMHGNVWEWCEDNWHENYEGAPNDGNAWTLGNNNIKVIRSGSWGINPAFCRSAFRLDLTRDLRSNGIGFRVARVALGTT